MRDMMVPIPILETERLVLRGPQASDLPAMPRVFHDPDIYAYTRNIPHPYGPGEAKACLERYDRLARSGEVLTLFPVERATGDLVGLVVLALKQDRPEAELGYAIGRDWWGKGYATEASLAMLRHGFEGLRLEEINAHAMVRNPASSRVLEKLGMRSVGLIEGACEKDGRQFDANGYVMGRGEWMAR